MKTFKCDFGDGVSCETQTSDLGPKAGQKHMLNVVWTGKRSLKHLRPYIEWMHTVNQTLADEWQSTLMYIYQTGPKTWEAWGYRPGQKPTREI